MVILLVILFYPVVKESERKFRFPLLFLVLAFGFFAALSTPPFYAMSNQGGLRQINMYYYAYYLWLAVSVLYLEGWIVSKIKEGGAFTKIAKFRYICIFVALVMIASGTVIYGLKSTAFFTTFLDLKSGRAQRYDAEYKRIVALIEQSGPEDVVYTSDINEWPNSFYRLGLENRGDVGYWVNSDMAKWFGVGAIELEE